MSSVLGIFGSLRDRSWRRGAKDSPAGPHLFSVEIWNIQAKGLLRSGSLSIAHRYYLRISVDTAQQQTVLAKPKDRLHTWKERFTFYDVQPSAKVRVIIYSPRDHRKGGHEIALVDLAEYIHGGEGPAACITIPDFSPSTTHLIKQDCHITFSLRITEQDRLLRRPPLALLPTVSDIFGGSLAAPQPQEHSASASSGSAYSGDGDVESVSSEVEVEEEEAEGGYSVLRSPKSPPKSPMSGVGVPGLTVAGGVVARMVDAVPSSGSNQGGLGVPGAPASAGPSVSPGGYMSRWKGKGKEKEKGEGVVGAGEKGREDPLDGVVYVPQLPATYRALMDKVKAFAQFANAIPSVGPFAKTAYHTLSGASNTITDLVDRDARVLRLLGAMNETYDALGSVSGGEAEYSLRKAQKLAPALATLSQQSAECGFFLEGYAVWRLGLVGATRTGSACEQEDIPGAGDAMRAYEHRFLQLKSAFYRNASKIDVGIVVFHSLSAPQDGDDDTRWLDAILHAPDASYLAAPSARCLPGTREQLTEDICAWALQPSSPHQQHAPPQHRVLWLAGRGGSGKSAVANTVSERFAAIGRLGGSFAFDVTRGGGGQRTSLYLFSTIARGMAMKDPRRRRALRRVVEGKGCKGTSGAGRSVVPGVQFEEMLLRPSFDDASTSGEAQQEAVVNIGPILIVIDGLDQCPDARAREKVLYILAKKIPSLPPNIRWLIAARPEPDIEAALSGPPFVLRKNVDAPDPVPHPNPNEHLDWQDRDVERVIEARLAPQHAHALDLEWRTRSGWLRALTRRADGCMAWAAVACDWVCAALDSGRAVERVRVLEQLAGGLDGLYRAILGDAFPPVLDQGPGQGQGTSAQGPASPQGQGQLQGQGGASDVERFKSVMTTLLSVREPLGLLTLKQLRGEERENQTIEHVFARVSFLLDGPVAPGTGGIAVSPSAPEAPITIKHATLRDFLLSPSRATKEWFVDASGGASASGAADERLALACLQVMRVGCRFNILGLESSYVCHNEIADFDARVRRHVSPALRYACRFWMEHASATPAGRRGSVRREVEEFLGKGLLVWLEVVSATGCVEAVREGMKGLVAWAEHNSKLKALVLDILNFLTVFSGLIASSYPHIYLSALPFTPPGSFVYKRYAPQLASALSVYYSHTLGWASLPAFKEPGHPVTALAFSPDGAYLAAAADRAVHVYDLRARGVRRPEPRVLRGHTGRIESVAFAPAEGGGGAKRRSGEQPTSPRQQGQQQQQQQQQQGHLLASASADGSVRVWSVPDGNCAVVIRPGVEQAVTDVAFDAAGCILFTASRDGTVQAWDARAPKQRTLVWGAMHARGVHRRAASGSPSSGKGKEREREKSAREKEKEDKGKEKEGKNVKCSPEEEAPFAISCMPDGKTLVSVGGDAAVRIWDAKTGEALCEMAHEMGGQWLTCVACSSGGLEVATGSGAAPSVPTTSATTTNSGSIGSGNGPSDANQILLWNTYSGNVTGTLKGHTGSVNSVAYARDGRLASGSDDCTVKVWAYNLYAGRLKTTTLRGHTAPVGPVAWAPDGGCVAGGAADGTVRVWNVAPPDPTLGNGGGGGGTPHGHGNGANASGSGYFESTNEWPQGWRYDEGTGWVVDGSKRLLFWVPPWARAGLWTPDTRHVIAQDSTRVLLSRFMIAHGNEWQNCVDESVTGIAPMVLSVGGKGEVMTVGMGGEPVRPCEDNLMVEPGMGKWPWDDVGYVERPKVADGSGSLFGWGAWKPPKFSFLRSASGL